MVGLLEKIEKVSNGDSTAVTAGDLDIELENQSAFVTGDNPIIVIFENGNSYKILFRITLLSGLFLIALISKFSLYLIMFPSIVVTKF